MRLGESNISKMKQPNSSADYNISKITSIYSTTGIGCHRQINSQCQLFSFAAKEVRMRIKGGGNFSVLALRLL